MELNGIAQQSRGGLLGHFFEKSGDFCTCENYIHPVLWSIPEKRIGENVNLIQS